MPDLKCIAVRSPMKCLICEGRANRSHYSVVACNSCASFFRRTILLKRNYLCTKRNCHLTGNVPMCKRCRLQKCIDKGMTIDSLLIRKVLSETDQHKDCALLENTINSLDSTFVNKINILAKLAYKNQMKFEMGILKPSRERMEISKRAEYQTLILYLKDCGYRELGLREIDLAKIAECSFYRWLFYIALTATIRNGGHHTQTIHFSDCGYLPLSYKSCCEYLHEHEVRDVDILGKPYFNLLDKGMRIGRRFHQANLSKIEFALLLQLLILKEAKDLFPSIKAIGDRLNDLLKEAYDYCEQNYQNVEIKFGELIFLLYDINVDIEYHQFALLLSLTGFKTTLPQISHDYGLV